MASDIEAEIRKDLIDTAIQSIQYVAYGQVMRREIADKFGITSNNAMQLIDKIVGEITPKIRELK